MKQTDAVIIQWMRCVRLAGLILFLGGCDHGNGPADSSTPAFSTTASRQQWVYNQLESARPSDVLDAQFRQIVSERRGGVEGPAYTARYFAARIEIAPANASKWASATRPTTMPRGRASLLEAPPVAMTEAEFNGCTWYDPTPIFGRTSGGTMGISKDKRFVFVYQAD